MLRISKLTDYASLLMAELARSGEECVPARHLAEATRLEPPTVAKVLKTLARSDLVDSIRGVNGGYQLARRPENISVAAIVRAMEGPIALTECALDKGVCSHEGQCSLRGNWQQIGLAVESALEELTLADLARPRPPRIAIRAEDPGAPLAKPIN